MRGARRPGITWTLAAALATIAGAAGATTRVQATTSAMAQRPDQVPAQGSDEAELWYAMERMERELRQSPLVVRDPKLNAYTRSVLCKVTLDYCANLRLYLVDMPYFNASMAPNGAMIVWTGALMRMQNEAQLALVLGHEFGHYRERHTLQQWRKLKRSSAFLSTFGIVASGAGVGIAGMAANLAGMASMMKFSRDKEREADRIGFAQLDAQGYDAHAGVELWDGMLREENARDYGKPIPVFSTHPQTRERRDDLRAAAETTAPGRIVGRQEFHAAVRPQLQHWLENELTRRMYSSSIQVIGDLRATAAAEDAGLYTFFLGEAHRRRGKVDDHARAAALYAEATGQPGAPPEAWREHGLALRQTGQPVPAADALRRYLALAPQARDRPFIEQYLADLGASP